jgi:hypothetical protein
MRIARVASVLLLIAVLTAVTADRAFALSQFGSTPCVGSLSNCVLLSWSGSGTQKVCGGTTGNLAVEVDWVMANSFTNTDTEWSRSCSDPRVRIYVVSAPSAGLVGWVNCPVGVATYAGDPVRQCQTTYLSVNSYYVNTETGDPNYLAAIMCHEFAHTVGVRHPTSVPGYPATGCVKNPATAGNWYLSSDDKLNLRNTYA